MKLDIFLQQIPDGDGAWWQSLASGLQWTLLVALFAWIIAFVVGSILGALLGQMLLGLVNGSFYAMLSLGLAVIFGLLNIINFAHGAALMMALYGVFFLRERLDLDPYLAIPIVVPAMFAAGYLLQRFVIGKAGHGRDENVLLVTLGLSIVLENLAQVLFRSDTRSIDVRERPQGLLDRF